MPSSPWFQELPLAITVCDRDGVCLEMNDRSAETFAKDGGRDLIGKNLLDCHPEPSRSRFLELLQSHQMNVYTIEKNGRKKLICQAPWSLHGEFQGVVEFSFDLPADLPHFVRG